MVKCGCDNGLPLEACDWRWSLNWTPFLQSVISNMYARHEVICKKTGKEVVGCVLGIIPSGESKLFTKLHIALNPKNYEYLQVVVRVLHMCHPQTLTRFNKLPTRLGIGKWEQSHYKHGLWPTTSLEPSTSSCNWYCSYKHLLFTSPPLFALTMLPIKCEKLRQEFKTLNPYSCTKWVKT